MHGASLTEATVEGGHFWGALLLPKAKTKWFGEEHKALQYTPDTQSHGLEVDSETYSSAKMIMTFQELWLKEGRRHGTPSGVCVVGRCWEACPSWVPASLV